MFEFLNKWIGFSKQISDEEFEKELKEGNAVQCPNCGCYIEYDMWEFEKHKCPNCKTKFECIKNNE